jgi:hypothetical protein
VIGGLRRARDVIEQVVVRLRLRPGAEFLRLSHAIAGASNSFRTTRIAATEAFAIAALGEEVEVDRRRLARVGVLMWMLPRLSGASDARSP